MQFGRRPLGQSMLTACLLLLTLLIQQHEAATTITVGTITATFTPAASTTTPTPVTASINTIVPATTSAQTSGTLNGLARTRNTANFMLSGPQLNAVTISKSNVNALVGSTTSYTVGMVCIGTCLPWTPMSRDTFSGPSYTNTILEVSSSGSVILYDPPNNAMTSFGQLSETSTIVMTVTDETIDLQAAISKNYVQIFDTHDNVALLRLTDAIVITLGTPASNTNQRWVFVGRSGGVIDILTMTPGVSSFNVQPYGRLVLSTYGFSDAIVQLAWAAGNLHIFGSTGNYLQLSTATWQNNKVTLPSSVGIVRYARPAQMASLTNPLIMIVSQNGAVYRWTPAQACVLDFFQINLNNKLFVPTFAPIYIIEMNAMVVANEVYAYMIDMSVYPINSTVCSITSTSLALTSTNAPTVSVRSVASNVLSAASSVVASVTSMVAPTTTSTGTSTPTIAWSRQTIACSVNSTSAGIAYQTQYSLACRNLGLSDSLYLRVDDGVTNSTQATLTYTLASSTFTLPAGPASNGNQITLRVYQPVLGSPDTLLYSVSIVVTPLTTPVAALVSSLSTITDPSAKLDVVAAISTSLSNATTVNTTQVSTVISTLNTVVSTNTTDTIVYRAISILNTLTSSASSLNAQFGNAMMTILTTTTSTAASVNTTQMDTLTCNQVLNIVTAIIGGNNLTTASNNAAITSLNNVAHLALGSQSQVQLTSTDKSIQIAMNQVTSTSNDAVSLSDATLSNINAAMSQLGATGGLARLMKINHDLYPQTSDLLVARSGYVAFSLLQSDGTEMAVNNLQQPLLLQIPISSILSSSADLNSTQQVCTFYNEASDVWDTTGCTYDATASTATTAACRCNHLTTFSIEFSKFTFAPNSIDANTAAALRHNYGIILIAAAFVAVWIGCVFAAMRFDRRNKLSAKTYGAMASKTAPTLYQIDLVNGNQALTSLTISLQSNGITEYYQLLRPVPVKSAQTFFVRGPEIGLLNGISILTHVATAEQNMDGTFEKGTIKSFEVINAGTFVHYDFGSIEVSAHGTAFATPVLVKTIQPSFMTRWRYLMRQNLPDRHSWASIFLRHKGSVFTSAERTMVCFLLLAANAACGLAWYHGSDASGMIAATILYKICIGLIVSVIVFAGTYPLVFLFRSARSFSTGPIPNATEEKADLLNDPSMPLEDRWHVGWRALAWGITLIVTLGCLVISILYTNQLWESSDQRGVLKSWIQSFFISVIESLFISQPFTVMVMAGWRARTKPNTSAMEALLEEKKRNNFGTIGARTSTSPLLPMEMVESSSSFVNASSMQRKRPTVQAIRTFGRSSLLHSAGNSFTSLPRHGSALLSPTGENNSLSRESDTSGSSTPVDVKASL